MYKYNIKPHQQQDDYLYFFDVDGKLLPEYKKLLYLCIDDFLVVTGTKGKNKECMEFISKRTLQFNKIHDSIPLSDLTKGKSKKNNDVLAIKITNRRKTAQDCLRYLENCGVIFIDGYDKGKNYSNIVTLNIKVLLKYRKDKNIKDLIDTLKTEPWKVEAKLGFTRSKADNIAIDKAVLILSESFKGKTVVNDSLGSKRKVQQVKKFIHYIINSTIRRNKYCVKITQYHAVKEANLFKSHTTFRRVIKKLLNLKILVLMAESYFRIDMEQLFLQFGSKIQAEKYKKYTILMGKFDKKTIVNPNKNRTEPKKTILSTCKKRIASSIVLSENDTKNVKKSDHSIEKQKERKEEQRNCGGSTVPSEPVVPQLGGNLNLKKASQEKNKSYDPLKANPLPAPAGLVEKERNFDMAIKVREKKKKSVSEETAVSLEDQFFPTESSSPEPCKEKRVSVSELNFDGIPQSKLEPIISSMKPSVKKLQYLWEVTAKRLYGVNMPSCSLSYAFACGLSKKLAKMRFDSAEKGTPGKVLVFALENWERFMNTRFAYIASPSKFPDAGLITGKFETFWEAYQFGFGKEASASDKSSNGKVIELQKHLDHALYVAKAAKEAEERAAETAKKALSLAVEAKKESSLMVERALRESTLLSQENPDSEKLRGAQQILKVLISKEG